MNDLVLQLEKIVDRFHEVSDLIVDPAIISDMIRYVKLNKEYKDLEPRCSKLLQLGLSAELI